MEDLIRLLEEALRRARAVVPGTMPEARIGLAAQAMRRVLNCFPPDVVHREVETLSGAKADSVELRGFGEPDPEDG